MQLTEIGEGLLREVFVVPGGLAARRRSAVLDSMAGKITAIAAFGPGLMTGKS